MFDWKKAEQINTLLFLALKCCFRIKKSRKKNGGKFIFKFFFALLTKSIELN